MNKDNAKDFLPLVQALADGKVVEINNGSENNPQWYEQSEYLFGASPKDYRIKPEPREFWVGLENGQVYDCKPSKEAILNMGSGIIIKVREILD